MCCHQTLATCTSATVRCNTLQRIEACADDAYSAEVDRLFRRNVTGDSAESAL
jgi:hypothetical protein